MADGLQEMSRLPTVEGLAGVEVIDGAADICPSLRGPTTLGGERESEPRERRMVPILELGARPGCEALLVRFATVPEPRRNLAERVLCAHFPVGLQDGAATE